MEPALAFGAPRPVKLTVEDFLVLDHAGALDAHRRAELIDGVITEMSPMGPRHAIVLSRMLVRLHDALAQTDTGLMALASPTIAIPPHNAPEPDITVTKNTDDDNYLDSRHAVLVIEISMSTLRYDMSVKWRLYAKASIAEYWVVDVGGRQVHQFWSPVDGVFTGSAVIPLDGELRSATMPDLAIDGAGIL